MWRSSELSISRSIPVIFPAKSACWRWRKVKIKSVWSWRIYNMNILWEFFTWISGKRRSPSICFCSCIGAAASIAVVRGSLTFVLFHSVLHVDDQAQCCQLCQGVTCPATTTLPCWVFACTAPGVGLPCTGKEFRASWGESCDLKSVLFLKDSEVMMNQSTPGYICTAVAVQSYPGWPLWVPACPVCSSLALPGDPALGVDPSPHLAAGSSAPC